MYHRSRSPASYSDLRGRSAFSRALNYTDLGLSTSTFVPRNRSVQRVMGSSFTRRDHSRSPPRDIPSPISRISTTRPISDSLTSDMSPALRRRELGLPLSESIPSSSNWTSSDEFSYKKPKTYYDLSSITPVYNTYSSSVAIKKPPKRIDYSDYLRPALQSRPMLKTNYIPRSRAEREGVVNPLIRERKLIKFREISNDIITRVRRKISWDISEDIIDSPLINELKKNEALNESITDRIRSRDSSLNRYGSKERLTLTPETRSPTCLSRRSSDKSIDGIPPRNLRLKSPRNSVILANNILEDDTPSMPMPPPRKKSLGSVLPKKKRKSSLENTSIDEKSLNYSLIADKILRDRRLSDAKSKEGNKEPTLPAMSDMDSKDVANEVKCDAAQNINSETEEERGRRRRRREISSDSDKSKERDGGRSRIRHSEKTQSSHDNPEMISRKHRKSVKHKMGDSSNRRLSKTLDEMTKSPFPAPISETSELDIKERNFNSTVMLEEKVSKAKKDEKENETITSKTLLGKKFDVDETLQPKKTEPYKSEVSSIIPDKSKHLSSDKYTEDKTSQKSSNIILSSKEKKAYTKSKTADFSDKLNVIDKAVKPKLNEAVIKDKEISSFSTLGKESNHPEKMNSNSQTTLNSKLISDNVQNKTEIFPTEKSSKISSTKEDKIKLNKTSKLDVDLHENNFKKAENTTGTNLGSNEQNHKTEGSTLKNIDKLSSQNNKTPDFNKGKEIAIGKCAEIEKKVINDKSNLQNIQEKNMKELKGQLKDDSKPVNEIPSKVEATKARQKPLEKLPLEPDSEKKNLYGDSKLRKEEKPNLLRKELENKKSENKILEEIDDKKNLKTLHSKDDKLLLSEKMELKSNLSFIAEDKKKIVNPLDLKVEVDKNNSNFLENANFSMPSNINLKPKVIKENSLSVPPKEKSIKDPYEVVVVCKLPQPKPKTITNSNASANMEIKTNAKLESTTENVSMKKTGKVINSLPEITIPTKQQPVVKNILANVASDSDKNIMNSISEKSKDLDVNVTHVVILKPKPQITKVEAKPVKEVTVSCPVLLKPIPDLVQSTIKLKTESDMKSNQTKTQVTNKSSLANEKPSDILSQFDSKFKADKSSKFTDESTKLEKSLTDSKVPDLLISSNEKHNLNQSKSLNAVEDSKDNLKTVKPLNLTNNLTNLIKKSNDENLIDSPKQINISNIKKDDNLINKQNDSKALSEQLSAETKFRKDIYSKDKESKPVAVKKVVRRAKTAENIDSKLDKYMEVSTSINDIKDVSSKFYQKSSTTPNMNAYLNKSAPNTNQLSTNESVLNKSESCLVASKENSSKISEKPDIVKKQDTKILPKQIKSEEKLFSLAQHDKLSTKQSDESLNQITKQNDKNFITDHKTNEIQSQTSKNSTILSQTKSVQNIVSLESKSVTNSKISSEVKSETKESELFLKQQKSKSDDSLVLESNLNLKASKLDNFASKDKQKSLETVSESKKNDKILNNSKLILDKKSSVESSNTSQSEVLTSTEKLKTSEIRSQNKKTDINSKPLKTVLENTVESKTKESSNTSKSEVATSTDKLKTLETISKINKNDNVSLPSKTLLQNNLSKTKECSSSKLDVKTSKDKVETSETKSQIKKSDEVSKQVAPESKYLLSKSKESSTKQEVKTSTEKVQTSETKSLIKKNEVSEPIKAVLENNSLLSKSKESSNTSKQEVTTSTDKVLTLETKTTNKKSDEVSKPVKTVLESNTLLSKSKESTCTSKQEVSTSTDKLKILKTDINSKPLKTVLENNSTVSKTNSSSPTCVSETQLKDSKKVTEIKENNLKPALINNKNVQESLPSKNTAKTNENSKTAVIKTLGMPCISEVNEAPKLENEKSKLINTESQSNKSKTLANQRDVKNEPKTSDVSKMDVNGNCEDKTDRARANEVKDIKESLPKDNKAQKKPDTSVPPNLPPKKQLKTPVAKLKKSADLPPSPRPTRYGLILSTNPRYASSSDSESWDSSSMSSYSSDEEEESSDDENLNNAKESTVRNKNKKSTPESTDTTVTNFANLSLGDSPTQSHEITKKIKFKQYKIDDFKFLKLLGKGSFGKVLLAELKDQDMYFAIKCLKKDVVLEDDDVESTMIERRVLAMGTQHPYMCKLYCTFQTKSYLFFVMEYLNGGDLMFHIQNGRFNEERSMFYAAEIVSALQFLHKRGIVYRDIKLDNVMLDRAGHIRLVDFGMCQCHIYHEECMPCNFCGTPNYIAPEIIRGSAYNQSVDWWSFGVLLFEMLLGRSPFVGTDEDELFWSICNEEPSYSQFLSRNAKDILQNLLIKTPNLRLGMPNCPAGEIRAHPFFQSINWEMLERMEIPPPFKPLVLAASDVNNFDRSFTQDSATLSPIDSNILASMDQGQFHGFSYTNPHIVG